MVYDCKIEDATAMYCKFVKSDSKLILYIKVKTEPSKNFCVLPW